MPFNNVNIIIGYFSPIWFNFVGFCFSVIFINENKYIGQIGPIS